jgi:hypothetical protein
LKQLRWPIERLPIVVTSSHNGSFLHHLLAEKKTSMPAPGPWAMKRTGRRRAIVRAAVNVRIDQPMASA